LKNLRTYTHTHTHAIAPAKYQHTKKTMKIQNARAQKNAHLLKNFSSRFLREIAEQVCDFCEKITCSASSQKAISLQGGKDPQDALSSLATFCKRVL